MIPEDDRGAGEDGEHSLTVSTRIESDRVVLSFADTGGGIPADVLPQVFEPLYSTKGFGVGLGLPAAQQILDIDIPQLRDGDAARQNLIEVGNCLHTHRRGLGQLDDATHSGCGRVADRDNRDIGIMGP